MAICTPCSRASDARALCRWEEPNCLDEGQRHIKFFVNGFLGGNRREIDWQWRITIVARYIVKELLKRWDCRRMTILRTAIRLKLRKTGFPRAKIC